MNKVTIILKATQVATEIAMAMEDGVVTGEEILKISEGILGQFNIKPKLMDSKVFIEQDGDLHIIVPKHVLNQMKVKV